MVLRSLAEYLGNSYKELKGMLNTNCIEFKLKSRDGRSELHPLHETQRLVEALRPSQL